VDGCSCTASCHAPAVLAAHPTSPRRGTEHRGPHSAQTGLAAPFSARWAWTVAQGPIGLSSRSGPAAVEGGGRPFPTGATAGRPSRVTRGRW
jgi:hypothetical protein